jgi:hypothetical protein
MVAHLHPKVLPVSRNPHAFDVGLLRPHADRTGEDGDCALYCCSEGHAFHAPVSTTVCCPRCGESQAW